MGPTRPNGPRDVGASCDGEAPGSTGRRVARLRGPSRSGRTPIAGETPSRRSPPSPVRSGPDAHERLLPGRRCRRDQDARPAGGRVRESHRFRRGRPRESLPRGPRRAAPGDHERNGAGAPERECREDEDRERRVRHRRLQLALRASCLVTDGTGPRALGPGAHRQRYDRRSARRRPGWLGDRSRRGDALQLPRLGSRAAGGPRRRLPDGRSGRRQVPRRSGRLRRRPAIHAPRPGHEPHRGLRQRHRGRRPRRPARRPDLGPLRADRGRGADRLRRGGPRGPGGDGARSGGRAASSGASPLVSSASLVWRKRRSTWSSSAASSRAARAWPTRWKRPFARSPPTRASSS